MLLGQYGKSEDGSKPAYLDDDTVKKDSKCVTFAAMTFNIENERWEGVPIMMRAGKALNESKVEIRLQYKAVASGVFKDIPNNELVIRVQPDAAVYLKFNAKTPGLSNATQVTDLNLTYASRYQDFWIPEALRSVDKRRLARRPLQLREGRRAGNQLGPLHPTTRAHRAPRRPNTGNLPLRFQSPKGLKEYMQKHKYVMPEKHPYACP